MAWICPVADVELLPARLMLDEEHSTPPYNTHYDENTYICGTINGHTVVVATCPQGETGNVNAGRLTGSMFKTFPNIRMAVLVGIGGGIPHPTVAKGPLDDIHLGDVVVGWPGDGKPACVYHDRGRSKVDGKFEIVGTMQNPDWRLMNALSILVSDHELGRTEFSDQLARLQDHKKFAYPRLERDRLFRAAYHHIGEYGSNCVACDRNQLVQRPQRTEDDKNKLVFHQGRIATGNSVIQDGELRDQISARCDGALCVEMEAAGVDVNRKCLVIRGISDYADSHKNDLWKSHAAGNAAAFARELLCRIQPDTVKGMEGKGGDGNLRTANKIAEKQSGTPTILNPPMSPEDILSICESFAQRRKSWNPWPKGSTDLFKKLQHWVSTPRSALFVVRADHCVGRCDDHRAKARAKDFAVEVADFLKSTTTHKVIWTFSLSTQPHMSIADIMNILIYQAIRYFPLQPNIPQTKANDTENQLFDLLRLALSRLSECFVVIETTNIEGLTRLLGLSQDIVGRSSSMIKILVVSYGVLPNLLQSNNRIVATIKRLPPRSRKPKGWRRARDTHWQHLNPRFSE